MYHGAREFFAQHHPVDRRTFSILWAISQWDPFWLGDGGCGVSKKGSVKWFELAKSNAINSLPLQCVLFVIVAYPFMGGAPLIQLGSACALLFYD